MTHPFGAYRDLIRAQVHRPFRKMPAKVEIINVDNYLD